MHEFLDWVQALPPFWSVFLMAMLPIVELRGAIPFAVSVHGMGYAEAYAIAVLGNLVPILPILLLLGPAERWLSRFRIFRRFFDWLFARTQRRGRLIERFKFLGLMLFVGIPLPVTGGWTGAAAAYVFGISVPRAFLGIALGVLIAGLVVCLAWAGGITVFTKLPV